MSGILGILGVNDHERIFLEKIGQSVIYDAATELLAAWNAEMIAKQATFVERETADYKIRYKLPGGGRLQRRGGEAQSLAVKSYGEWDVGFPLEEFGAQVSSSRRAFAYMTTQDLDRHMDTVMLQGTATARYEILKAILNNTQRAFDDENQGSINVEPLANGDTVVYPPVEGSEDEATEDHYLVSGYTAANISDTNNPFVTIVDDLEHHFGIPTGGSNIVTFINKDEVPEVEALTDFEPVSQNFVAEGDDTALAVGLPNSVPGKILGYCSGSWVARWDWVPSAYALGIHLDAPRPLIRRVPPADTGLPRGLSLVSNDAAYPFSSSHYEYHFGYGVGNRLNGAVMQFKATGTYDVPSGY